MKTVSPVNAVPTLRYHRGGLINEDDLVAVEEPLQIKLQYQKNSHWKEIDLTITMRTPGHDIELAIGLLLAENILHSPKDLEIIRYCKRVKTEEKGNVLIARLAPHLSLDINLLNRHFLATSSCGVCGKSAIEAISCDELPLEPGQPIIKSSQLIALNHRILEEQTIFKYTGGIHATALFDLSGKLILLREDVGRHNAFDKVVGAAFQSNLLPLVHYLVMLSGRISFELVQKAIRAQIPIIAAVGAPSSLAVSLAKDKRITLIGFLKPDRFNVYCGKERVDMD
jgi:FdhD protein